MRDSDRKLDCDDLLMCEDPAEGAVEGRPGHGCVSIDSLSKVFDSATTRLLFGCMLTRQNLKHRLTPGKRRVSYGPIWIATYPCLLS